MHQPSTNALQLCSGQNAVLTVQCCSAKQAQKQAVCHCTYIYGDILFIQVCSDPAPMHCSKVQGKMQSLLFSAALQNRLKSRQSVTALTPKEMCSAYRCAVTQHQCIATRFRAKCSPHCSVLLCKLGSKAGSVSLQLHLWRCALHTGVQLPSTNALQKGSQQNAVPTVECCSAKQAHTRGKVPPSFVSKTYRNLPAILASAGKLSLQLHL